MDTFISNFPDGAGASAPASARSGAASSAGRTDSPLSTQRASAAPAADSPGDVREAAAPENLEEQLRLANRHLARLDSRLQFRVDEPSGRMVIAVVHRETAEVLRQFPSEEMLAISRRLETHLAELNARTGLLLVDEA